MNSKTYYYARVSTTEQNLDRQLDIFHSLGAEDRDIITDKQSGKDLDRPGYTALKTTILRPGDTLIIKSLDRLSRSKLDIKNELQYFKDNNIRIKVIDFPTTMLDLPEEQSWVIDMVNNILIEMLSSIAEQEYHTIHKRQSEGIAAALPQTPEFIAFIFPKMGRKNRRQKSAVHFGVKSAQPLRSHSCVAVSCRTEKANYIINNCLEDYSIYTVCVTLPLWSKTTVITLFLAYNKASETILRKPFTHFLGKLGL